MSILELTLSMSSKTSNFAIMAGASSMIFWCLLWMEQSRPNNDIALPYWSAKSWTSKCLAHLANFIMNIGDPGTSAWTYLNNIIIISLIHFYLWFLSSFPPPPFLFHLSKLIGKFFAAFNFTYTLSSSTFGCFYHDRKSYFLRRR